MDFDFVVCQNGKNEGSPLTKISCQSFVFILPCGALCICKIKINVGHSKAGK